MPVPPGSRVPFDLGRDSVSSAAHPAPPAAQQQPWPPEDGTYYYTPALPPSEFRERKWRHIALLALTVVTTTVVGMEHYAGFALDFGADAQGLDDQLSSPLFYLRGLWYSLTVLAILGCHEMGHYAFCRYYRVNASLPYFLPAPLPLTGTLGAFIKIRSRIPSKIALFDIGIAGPIAGFIVAVPALFVGLSLSRVVAVPDNMTGLELGEPLLFRMVAYLVLGDIPDGSTINMHPMAFAAWFGLLATALNLFPVGQLDGGHISYAVLGRRSTWVTLGMVIVAIALTAISWSWLTWTGLLILMLFIVGPHHPPTLNDQVPLDRARLWLAALALIILVLCFTPAPIEPFVTGGR
ncbi:MAG: site-2 protease family protein [Vicinamibacterales bacterium]